MLDLDQIIEKLKRRNLSEVADNVKVTRSYLSAIVNGKRVNPSYQLMKKLEKELNQ